MSKKTRIDVKPYLVAILSVFAATVLTQLINPFLSSISLALFYGAVAVTTWYGGRKPGLLAIALSTATICYFFLPPINSLAVYNYGDILRLIISILVALLINYLVAELKTAKQQIEQLSKRQLQESEQKFRHAVLDSPMPTIIHAEDGEVVLVNQIWVDITGYTQAEIPTIADWTEKAYGERRETIRAGIDRLYRLDRRIAEGEYTIATKTGESRVWEFCSAPLGSLSDGRRLVISTALDITDRKIAEEALRRSEQRYRSLVNATAQIVWITDGDGLTTVTPLGWEEITGQTTEEVLGWGWLSTVHPDDRERSRLRWMEAYKNRTLYETEYRLRMKDGSYCDYAVRGTPILGSDGNICEWIGTCTDISQRKQAETALQKYNEELEKRVAERTVELTLVNDRLLASLTEQERDRQILQEQAQLLDLAHDTIMTRDLNGTIAFWNRGAERMYGFSKSEALGKQYHLLLQTKFPQRLAEIETEIINQGYWEGELIHTTRNGRSIVVSTRCVVQKNAAGEPIKILEINNDITEQKEAESALRRSESNLRQAQKVAHIGSWEHDFITEINIWSEELYRIYGRDFNTPPPDTEEILNSIIYPDDREIYLNEIVEKTKLGQPFETDLRIIRTDGEIRYIEARGEPVFNQQGELISLIGSALDITDRKQAEATLQEANRRWRSLLDNVQLMVVGLDLMGNVDYVNPFFLKAIGYELTEVIGKNWFDNFLPLSDRQQINTVFHEVLKYNFHPYYENPILTKSGEERFIAWNNTLLQDVKGNIIGTISIGEDITQRQIVERMKNEFISIVSHELRTPLTAIHGSLGLLATGIYDNKPEKAHRMIQIAVADSERLVRLVNDILDLERLDSGRVTLMRKDCDAVALMQRSVEGVQAIADRQAMTMFVVPSSVKVWAAPDAIVQTLTNLLSNAIKFSPPNSTISLSAQIQSDFVLFQVKDRGRGIPADKLETIFGRFQQVDLSDSRQKGGTGLGLAICQSIVQQHGGRIWVESTLGEGSTFYFTLPISGEKLENDQQTNFSS